MKRLCISFQEKQKLIGKTKTIEELCQEELNKLNKKEKKAIIYYQED
jgi:hypothetical protein